MSRQYKFVTICGCEIGLYRDKFRWFYLHGHSSFKAGGVQIGWFGLIW